MEDSLRNIFSFFFFLLQLKSWWFYLCFHIFVRHLHGKFSKIEFFIIVYLMKNGQSNGL